MQNLRPTFQEMTAGLLYKTADINKNFVLRVRIQGSRRTHLVGVSTLCLLIGSDFVNRFFEKAYNNGQQKSTFKLRRGIEVTFASK